MEVLGPEVSTEAGITKNIAHPKKIDDSELPPATVVGGHIGILSDRESKTILKPISGIRGDREEKFYRSVFHDDNLSIPRHLFPIFHGVKGFDNSMEQGEKNEENKRFLIIEDLCHKYKNPCIMDLKIGTQTWGHDATQKKIDSQSSKYPPQQVLGFRITGMRIWVPHEVDASGEGLSLQKENILKLKTNPIVTKSAIHTKGGEISGEWRSYGRPLGLSYSEHDIIDGLRAFVSFRGKILTNVVQSFVNQLKSIQKWFQSQTSWEFFGSSLLFVYEAGEETIYSSEDEDTSTPSLPQSSPNIQNQANILSDSFPAPPAVKMIDFAHVWPIANDSRDEGYLLGVTNIMNRFEKILSSAL